MSSIIVVVWKDEHWKAPTTLSKAFLTEFYMPPCVGLGVTWATKKDRRFALVFKDEVAEKIQKILLKDAPRTLHSVTVRSAQKVGGGKREQKRVNETQRVQRSLLPLPTRGSIKMPAVCGPGGDD